MLPYRFVRWVTASPKPLMELNLTSSTARGQDSRENPVLFFENEWSIRLAQEKNPGLALAEIEPMAEFA
jgi:peptide chain release factor 3